MSNANTQLQGRVDNSDLADYYTKPQIDNNQFLEKVIQSNTN